ncbi:TPA: helix-turn-helix domain-containing protein [Klebsiella aerogenes]|nr:helix-turn-helix domain-containing protein [Klebsiella aerogenes]HEC1359214.1 helix-turn-helix domain-containing protein [Klebsiella aerogenes]
MNTITECSVLSKSKPVKEIQYIIEKVAPFAEPFTASKGEVLRYNIASKHNCYILHTGSVTLNRRGDGLILNAENAPFILGVSNQFATSENLYVKVMEDSQMSRLSVERFNLLAESYNLWQNLCYLLIYNATKVYSHASMICQLSSYDLIKFQLQELINEPEKIRLNITAANYILNRTYLSRSGVMRILASLKTQGHIILQRGILIKINNLPSEFVS